MVRKPNVSLPAAQLTLPGGFTITVRYRTDKQIRREAGLDVFGYWAQGTNGGKIVLNRDAPQWRQFKTFGHELVHAVHDYAHWLDRRADVLEKEAAETARALKEDEEDD